MVIADLQLGDAGLLPQAGFQLRQNALGVVADGAQLVHLGMVAFGNDTAILEGGGGFRVHGCINLLALMSSSGSICAASSASSGQLQALRLPACRPGRRSQVWASA